MITRFGEEATVEFATNADLRNQNPSIRRTSFLFAGYLYSDRGYLPAYGVVSNFQTAGPLLSEEASAFTPFRVSTGSLKKEEQCITVAIGDTGV